MAEKVKKIAKLEVIKAGSNPDIDTDFRTDIRETVIEHVTEEYGKDSVANIITFGSMAAKGSFKAMCTIYQVPFAQANKIASLIPGPNDGNDCTLEDIFNPESDRYSEGADFRAAVEGEYWKDIIEGARAIEGRYKSTGVHACGLIISSKNLSDYMPLMVRQNDGRVITQWTYPECEDMGFIKFDFLGLDTVDLVQYTVEYIKKNGKTPPNMLEIALGDMDDKETYDMLCKGETIGVFQIGTDIVRDYLKFMKPDKFTDIAACTAIMRPGPMGMQSHVQYANRKNGLTPIAPIHRDFDSRPDLNEILDETQGLIVYQESILQIANRIANMTLKEGDELRKAMGKKKIKIMEAMKPRFIEGGLANGYSEEAMNILWDTIALFAKYGFNKAHSIAYAQLAYETAYLKKHYPVEFMAALIAQNTDDRDKTLTFLQESSRLGIRVGSIDVNVSDIRVAPDYKNVSDFDIVYGLSGVKAVSINNAEIIVKEREENGLYESVQDFINRLAPLGITNKKVYENIALGGGFDGFGVTRKSVIENLPAMIGEAKNKKTMGASLFDMFGEDEASDIELSSTDEYPYIEKLQYEADVIGLYLTGHPLDNMGSGLGNNKVIKINELLKHERSVTVNVIGSITEIEKKILKRGGKSVKITIDDGTGYIEGNLNQSIIKGIDKYSFQERARNLYQSGEKGLSDDLLKVATNSEYNAIPDIEKNNVYILNLTFRPGNEDMSPAGRINTIKKLELSDEGKLPVRVRVAIKHSKNYDAVKKKLDIFAKAVAKKCPGEYPLFIALFTENDRIKVTDDGEYYQALNAKMIEDAKISNSKEDSTKKIASNSMFGESSTVKKVDDKKILKELPEYDKSAFPHEIFNEGELSDNLTYYDTGVKVAKNNSLEELLVSKFGAERVDFGLFDESMNESE